MRYIGPTAGPTAQFDPRPIVAEAQYQEASQPQFPSAIDVGAARNVNALYGDPYSGLYEGREGSQANLITAEDAADVYNDPKGMRLMPEAVQRGVPPVVSDVLYRGRMAANRSALAGIGMDPDKTAFSLPNDQRLGVYGYTQPELGNEAWVGLYPEHPSTYVHESMHRGMQKLREAGVSVPSLRDEEDYVRAMMLRNYGGIELVPNKPNAQIQKARVRMRDDPEFRADLDRIERAAAEQVKQRRPYGGPR